MKTEEKIICPDCKEVIEMNDSIQVGDIVECQECGTEVEILSLSPLTFAELTEEK